MLATHYPVKIPVENGFINGDLEIPDHPKAIVIFSHGSGSSRLSKRNKMVAERLQEESFATLLFDLLTEQEDQNYSNRFNIELLTKRLMHVTKWVQQFPETAILPIGYFGASTGAASAIAAASALPDIIKAVVSRGGRPDLAEEALDEDKSPTLLIVGGLDIPVIGLNEEAYKRLPGKKKIIVVPGATHLFEEEGKLDEVADLAIEWFKKYLA